MTDQTTKTVDLSPNKEIYRSAAVDVSPIDAVEELGDNALDNWERVSQRVDDITIDIEAKDGLTCVRDDTGGLQPDDIKLLFALGETFQHDIAGSIGAYGIGAKKALVRLGEERTVKSRARDADTAVGFHVDEAWLDSEQWEVELQEFDDLEPGVTELIVESSETIWDDEHVERLKETLSRTYAKFLSRSAQQGGRLTITVNGEELEPPEPVPWSFTPFDGLHPRRFEGIELYPKGIDAPVYMDVTVGLMRKQKSEIAGTDIYAQDRLVTQAEQGEVGGYGSVSDDRIGNFTDHKSRTRVIVELRTDGDSSDLPWDAQKSTIDPYHPVSQAMYSWLRRIVRPYFKSDANEVPRAFVAPYDSENPHAANNGEVEALDYSGGRSKVNDRPNDNLDQVKDVKKTARSHAARGILVTDMYEPALQVAYEAEVRSQFDGASDELEKKTKDELEADATVEPDDDEMTVADVLADINGAGSAKEEALIGAGYHTAEDLRDASIEELTAVDGVGTKLADAIKEVVSEDEVGGDEGETEEGDTEAEADADEDADDDTDGGQESVEQDVTEIQEEDQTEAEATTEDDSTRFEMEPEPGAVQIPVRVSDEEFERLRDQLGLDDEASPADLGEQLGPRVVAMLAPSVQ